MDIRKKIRRNWRLKVHHMAMSCLRGGPLRHVCGQSINPTAMICTFLESPIDLDAHTKKRFAFLAKSVEIDVAETTKFAHVARTDEVRVLLVTIFFFFFLTF